MMKQNIVCKQLALKAPITTTADDCDIFPNFQQK